MKAKSQERHEWTASKLKPRSRRANKHTSSLWPCQLNTCDLSKVCLVPEYELKLALRPNLKITPFEGFRFYIFVWKHGLSTLLCPFFPCPNPAPSYHSFCLSSKCFKHLTFFSGIQSCTDLPHKSTLSNISYNLICISFPPCLLRNYRQPQGLSWKKSWESWNHMIYFYPVYRVSRKLLPAQTTEPFFYRLFFASQPSCTM